MDTQQKQQLRWNPTSPLYIQNPYPILEDHLLNNPIQQGKFGEWIFFRYQDVKQILRDENLITSDLTGFFELKEKTILKNTNQCPFLAKSTKKWLMYLDGKEHEVARELVERLLQCYDLTEIVKKCLEEWFEDNFKHERLNLGLIASVLPSKIFLEMLQSPKQVWNNFEKLQNVANSLGNSQDVFVSIKQYQNYNEDAGWLFELISDEFESNSTSNTNSLITNIQRINAEMGSQFSKDELISILIILFFASVETTFHTLTISMLEFFKNPVLFDYIINANEKQINILAEELLRFASPQQYTIRINKDPLEFKGNIIPPNSKMLLCLASANRDPSVFKNPHEIIVDRNNNPHLTFGSGTHSCMGAKLARTELRTLLKPLACILKNYQLDDSITHEWEKTVFMRGLKDLWAIKSN